MVNGIVSHQDWLPTFLAATGEPDIKEKLLNGHKAGDKTFRVHLDGFNMLSYLTGEVQQSPREFFFYISDDGDILAIRMRDWKVVLMEQRAKRMLCWAEPFVRLRVPKIFHLRRDPFERADENSNDYWNWMMRHAYIIYAMQAVVAGQIENFRKFPPRQKPPLSTWMRCCGHWKTQAAAAATDLSTFMNEKLRFYVRRTRRAQHQTDAPQQRDSEMNNRSPH